MRDEWDEVIYFRAYLVADVVEWLKQNRRSVEEQVKSRQHSNK